MRKEKGLPRHQAGFAPIFIVLIIAALAFGGYYYFGIQKAKRSEPAQQAKISQATPAPKVDETANWKTLDYPNFGYSFKMPASYVVSQNRPVPTETYILQNLSLNETDASMGPNDFIVTVGSQDVNSSLKNLTANNSGLSKTGTKVINGKEWTVASSSRETIYLIQLQGRTYTVDGRNIPLLEKILSTFKFTDPNQTVDTSNWKIYTNTKYKFSFQYPPRLFTEEKIPSENDRKKYPGLDTLLHQRFWSSESSPDARLPEDLSKQKEFLDNTMMIQLKVFDNPQSLPLKSFIKTLYNTTGISGKTTVFQDMEKQGFTPTSIPLPNSLMFIGSFTENPVKVYYFSTDKQVYEVTLMGGFGTGDDYSEKAEKEFDKILSNFKFN